MTKYLLDTHVVLWIAGNPAMLSEAAKNAVLDASAEKFVSIVSAWEVAIKLGTKKLRLEGGLPEFFRMIDDNGFSIVSVEREYVRRIPALPDHHKDPFDRLLVTTAAAEEMTLITIDENIHKYNVSLLW
jgi:PIN domain nuclease of toxin-antitoxin system